MTDLELKRLDRFFQDRASQARHPKTPETERDINRLVDDALTLLGMEDFAREIRDFRYGQQLAAKSAGTAPIEPPQ